MDADLVKRVASRFLKAQGVEVSLEEHTEAIPQSTPGLSMMSGMMDELNAAFESKDSRKFDKVLEKLYQSAKKTNP
jgi:hypothetical protein